MLRMGIEQPDKKNVLFDMLSHDHLGEKFNPLNLKRNKEKKQWFYLV